MIPLEPNMVLIGVVFALAFVVEALVEFLGICFPVLTRLKADKVNGQMVVSFLLSLLIAYGAGLDIFAILGVKFGIPLVGCFIVAVIMSRGSLYVHDFFSGISKFKETQKATAALQSERFSIEQSINNNARAYMPGVPLARSDTE